MSTFFIRFTVRIKCRDLVKKIAIYRHRLAVSIEIIVHLVCGSLVLSNLSVGHLFLLAFFSSEDSYSLLLCSIIMLFTCPFLPLSGPIA